MRMHHVQREALAMCDTHDTALVAMLIFAKDSGKACWHPFLQLLQQSAVYAGKGADKSCR